MVEADQPPSRRKRHFSIFDRLVQWVQSHDGAYVHPHVDLTTDRRSGYGSQRFLRAVLPNPVDDGNEGGRDVDNGTNALEDNHVVIRKGEVVFSIPYDVLITAGSCEPLPDSFTREFKYVPRSDIQLAVYLASQPAQIRPYLDALPGKEATDEALPRCWTTDEMEEFLAGSPVVDNIREQRKEVQDAHDALASLENFSASSLSFRSFSQCLAVVTSRAFQGFTPSHGPCCLVPLLDLCNHGRGRTAPASNLSYRWDADQERVVVEAKSNLYGNDPLIITYGSQGNASLLLNYGFCIFSNLEPDGSSNDRYELRVGASRVVSLRAGPKEYSYNDLVNALGVIAESLQMPPSQEVVSANEPRVGFEGVDDIESFLDECDAGDVDGASSRSVRDDGEGSDAGDDKSVGGWEYERGNSNLSLLHLDMRALEALGISLEQARSKYKVSNDELLRLLRDQKGFSKQQHAAILLQSELRTLYFFHRTVGRILSILATTNLDRTSHKTIPLRPRKTPTPTPAWMSPSDSALIESQVDALTRVFIQIRHGALDLGFLVGHGL